MIEQREPPLLPCPFCGQPAEYDSQRWVPSYRPYFKSLTGHAIMCSECEAEMSLFECYEDAAEAWNRRTLPPSAAPSQPQQKDLVAASVLDPEPGHPSNPAVDEARAIIQDCWGALNFILAFYEPGQRYLDTNAWKQAEASGRRAHAASRAWLDAVPPTGPTNEGHGR